MTETGTCSRIPEETAGPYPGDGSNGPNALAQSGIVRSDIRSSFGNATGITIGIPLTVTLNLVGASGGCAVLAGYAVYLWHCDQGGLYSLYSAGVTDQNYLRGVQTTDGGGNVSFQTVFPGCYSGRWPHIHFEVFPSIDAAAAASGKVATSQLALPEDASSAVYATSGYSASANNLRQISLATDNVFSDGASLQIPAMTGNASDGYAATLTVPIAG
jgi:protocatechuate 3,4-dioxygenase beta subunit